MQKIKKILIHSFSFIFIVLFIIFPFITLAQTDPPSGSVSQGLIPCGRSSGDADPSTTHPCTFNDLLTLVNTIINFILYKMVIPIAAIMFAYAGFSMVTAPGGEAKSKAKNVFSNTVKGLIFAMSAFLIVKLLLTILRWDGGWIGFL